MRLYVTFISIPFSLISGYQALKYWDLCGLLPQREQIISLPQTVGTVVTHLKPISYGN